MIAADTSTWITYLQGDSGPDVQALDRALQDQHLLMVPAVLSELLSDPKLSPSVARILCDIPLVEQLDGYWERAGLLRARVLARKRKARLGDALIAQSCLDNAVTLLTRDRDFRGFAEAASLQLVLGGTP